jgi:hypothetical protein
MLIEDVTPCLFKLFFYCLELTPPSSYVGWLLGGCTDEKIALLGAIQSLFEGSMYTFVFLWTPALSPNKQAIPHGFIFATFMLASMLGSSLASRLLARTDLKVESYMQLVFLVAAGSLCLPVLITVSSEFPASLGVYVAWFLLLQIPSFSDLSADILLTGLLHSYSQVFGILLSSLSAGFCGNSGQASMNHRGHQMAALVRDECESSHCMYDAKWMK